MNREESLRKRSLQTGPHPKTQSWLSCGSWGCSGGPQTPSARARTGRQTPPSIGPSHPRSGSRQTPRPRPQHHHGGGPAARASCRRGQGEEETAPSRLRRQDARPPTAAAAGSVVTRVALVATCTGLSLSEGGQIWGPGSMGPVSTYGEFNGGCQGDGTTACAAH